MRRVSFGAIALALIVLNGCSNSSNYAPPRLSFTQVPADQTVAPGQALTLSVAAQTDSIKPITYTWQKLTGSGTVDVGTGPTLTVDAASLQTGCDLASDGYQVVATAGSLTAEHTFVIDTHNDAVCGALFTGTAGVAGASELRLVVTPGTVLFRRPGEAIDLSAALLGDSSATFTWEQITGNGGARTVSNTAALQLTAPSLQGNCDTIELLFEVRAITTTTSASEVVAVEIVSPVCTYTRTDGLVANATTKVIVTSDDRLVVGTEDGLSVFDGKIWSNSRTGGVDPSGSRRTLRYVTALAEAPAAISAIWVGNAVYFTGFGLDGRGIERLTSSGFEKDLITAPESELATEIAFDLSPSPGSASITGASDATTGVGGATRGNLPSFSATTPLISGTSVFATDADQFGFRWYGTGAAKSTATSKGILVFSGNNKVASFDGSQWNGVGITRFSDNRDIRALLADANGDIWIGLHQSTFEAGGLVRYIPDAVVPLRGAFSAKPESLPKSNDVRALALDGNNNLWIATPAGLVVRYAADGTFQRVTKDDGLSSNDVRDVYYDAESRFMWAATANGVTRLAIPFFLNVVDYTD